MSSDSPIRICLLTGHTEIADWMVDSLRQTVRTSNAEIPLVVHATQPNDDSDARSDSESRIKGYARAGAKYAKDAIKRDPQTYTHLSNIKCVASAERIRCKTKSAESLGVVVPSSVVETIADTCDVVVHFEVGILQGDILSRPKYGVLSFHHGNIRQYRGGPAGFWEFLHDSPRGGVTLQQLTPELDAGYIVEFESVDLTDAHTWAEIRRRLFHSSPEVLAAGVRNLQNQSFEPTSVPDEELGPIYYTSELTPRVQAKYLLKEIRGLLTTR